jgi:hypothetical protein
MKGGAAMKISGYAAVAVMVAGAAMMPSTASAAEFTLNSNSCVGANCTSFTGSVTISITDSQDPNDVDFSVVNNSNGVIDFLRFGYGPTPAGVAQVTNFNPGSGSKVHEPTASFVAGTDAGIGYNVSLDFKSGNGNQFDPNDAATFTLGSSNFNFDATGFSSALGHVVELKIGGKDVTLTTGGGGNTGGGGQTVPEPASIALFGCAALAVANRLRRRESK